MRAPGTFKALGIGLLSGLVAALAMTVVMLVLRLLAGIPLVAELGGDRFLPFVGVSDFLDLLGRFGGPIGAKRFALISSFEGILLTGVLVGALYALVAERGRLANSRRFNVTRRGGLFAVVVVAAIWVVSLALFSGVGWPWNVLSASFLGLPPVWASITTALGLLISYASYGVVLVATYGAITGRRSLQRPTPPGIPVGRRAFLAGGGVVILALASDWLTGRLVSRSVLPYDGMEYLGSDIQPITPNDQFYVVTKSIIDPRVKKGLWRLSIGGMVEEPRTYSFEELSSLPSVEQEMTLECISNPIGGGLMSNAIWEGVRLRDMIEAARPQSGVEDVLFQAADGYAHTASPEVLTDPNALIAYRMNGEPLPDRHGYPVRALVPGYYGEASVKWLTRIELLDQDTKRYYAIQGWEAKGVAISSRFYAPDFGQVTPRVGMNIPLRGIAFSGAQGISMVKVSTDGGQSWQQAEITYTPNSEVAWVHWRYNWQPGSVGESRLIVRATDGNGNLQTSEGSSINPDGATGRQQITVNVEA